MQEFERLVDRGGWPEGPWDGEPDMVVEPPMLCLRLGNGSWGALCGVDKALQERAVLLQKAQSEFEGRRLEILTFDERSNGYQHIDCSKLYIGFFCSGPGETRPRELRYLMGIPEYIREHYKTEAGYTNVQQIKAYGEQLCQFLRNKGLLPDTVNKAAQTADV